MKEIAGWVKIKKYTDDGFPRCYSCRMYNYDPSKDSCEDMEDGKPGPTCPIWYGEIKSGWQPIETAPTDGTTLLLLGWWRTWPKKEFVYEAGIAGNLERQTGCFLHGAATHWMPLPSPPQEK